MHPASTSAATASARSYGPPNVLPNASAYEQKLDTWVGGKAARHAARERILAWIGDGDASKVLNLGALGLDELPPLPPGIRKLKADKNNLTSAPENLPHTLEALDLHGNCLLHLPESLPFASLRLLNVAGNAIEQLPESLRQLDANCKVYLTGNQIAPERIDELFGAPQNTNGLRYPRQHASVAPPPDQTAGAREPAPPRESGHVMQFAASLRDLIGQTVYDGDIVVARQLLQQGSCDINAPWESCNNFNFLGIAINRGYPGMVKLLLEQPGIDPNRSGGGRPHPLNAAIMGKRIDILAALLAHPGIDPNVDAHLQLSPLYVATQCGQTEMVKALLKHPKTNPNLGGPAAEGNTPLAMAADQGNLALAQALLAHRDIDSNLAITNGGASPLYLACQGGFAPITAALLGHPRIRPNATTSENLETPLHVAAHKGHLPVVQMLLADPRVDANLRVTGNRTPLYDAASQGHAEIVDCLLKRKEKRVDPNLAVTGGNTPLMAAVLNRDEKVASRLLSEKSVRVNARSGPDKTSPLMAAIGMHNASMVKLLLSSETIDPNLKCLDIGITPLQFAITQGELSVIRTLLNDPRVDVNRKSDTGADAIYLAVAAKREDIVVALIERGARIEALSQPKDRQFAMLALGKACLSALATEIGAQALLDKLAQMPQQDAALRLVAIAMQSAKAPLEKTLEDLPLLKRAVLLDRPGLREAVSGLLGAWGASFLDDRGKLPPLTRDILAAWKL